MPAPRPTHSDYYCGFLNKTIKLSHESQKNIAYILEIEKPFNIEAGERAQRIKKALENTYTPLIVEARSYKNLTEGQGSEIIKPRNYVTKEVIQIKAGLLDYVFFVGDFGTPEEAESYIINKLTQIHERRSGKTKYRSLKARRTIQLNREIIDSIRTQFKRS